MVKQQQGQPPAPVAGALTVEMAGIQGSASRPDVIEVLGPKSAPTTPSTLRDPTGLHTGQAVPRKTGCKPDVRPVAFATGSTPWCIELMNIAAGHELSGSVENGSGDTLTLTVRRRDAFWGGPAVVLVAGLLVGLFAAAIAKRLRGRVRELVLARLLQTNNLATRGSHIDGLNDWVSEREKEGQDRDTIIVAVNRVVTYGPDLARLARARLSAALDAAQNTREPAKLKAAAMELLERPSPRIGEFYTDDGSKLTEHPADVLASAVTRAAEIRAELDAAQSALGEIPEAAAKAARDAFTTAESRYESLATPEQVGQMDSALQALQNQIALARSATPRTAGLIRTARRSSAPHLATRGAIATETEPTGGTVTLEGQTAAALLVTALLALLVVGYASVTIWSAAYDSKPLFHEFGDYLTLFSAALGSSAAGSVLALVGYWQVTDSPAGS